MAAKTQGSALMVIRMLFVTSSTGVNAQMVWRRNRETAYQVKFFRKGFFTKLTNFFRRKPTVPPSETTITYRRYQSPDDDLFGGVPPGGLCVSSHDCAGYPASFCDNGICRCSKGALNAGSTCVRHASQRNPSASCQTGQVYVEQAGACMIVQYPGQPCQYSEQCNGAEQGAYCLRLRCECPYGMTISGMSCAFSNPNCKQREHIWIEELGECKPEGFFTKLTNFFRRKPTVPPSETTITYRRYQSPDDDLFGGVPPDGLCVSSHDCAGYPASFCDNGICRCSKGALNAGSTCVRHASQRNPSASCQTGQVYVEQAGACMIVQYPGQPCQYSEQCNGAEQGAYCLRLRCECPYGMTISGMSCAFSNPNCKQREHIWIEELGECKPVISPGLKGCSHSSQCSSAYMGTHCVHQMCTCPPPLYPVDGTCGQRCPQGHTYSSIAGECLPTVLPGEKCLYSSQCSAMQEETLCDRGRCRCTGGRVFSGTQCTAVCPQGFVVNRYGLCRPGEALPMDSCAGGEECVGGSYCSNGKCVCPIGTKVVNGQCITPVTECTKNQVEHDGDCYEKVGIGQKCEVSAQCSGHSVCVDDLCTCPANMVVRSGVCHPREALPMDSCAGGEECVGGSYCSNGKCVCPIGTKVVNGQCITPVTVPAGGSCPTGVEICLGGSSCVNGICQCPFGTAAELGECVAVKTVSVGSSCSPSRLCTGLSICVQGVCRCPKGMSIQNDECHSSAKSGIGSTCANGETCTDGSVCSDSVRIVRTVYVSVRQAKYERVVNVPQGEEDFLQNVPILRNVEEDLTVILNVTYVFAQVSRVASTGFASVMKDESLDLENVSSLRKFPGRELSLLDKVATLPGDPCGRGEICTGGSSCAEGICMCPSHLIVYEQKCRVQPMSPPGKACGRGEKCIGGSMCDYDQKVCVCADGLYANDGICQPPVDAMTFEIQPVSMTEPATSIHTFPITTATSRPYGSTTRPSFPSRRPSKGNTRTNLLLRTRDSWSIPGLPQTSTSRQTSTSIQASILGQTSTSSQASTLSQTITSRQASTLGQAITSSQTSTLGQTRPLSQTSATSQTNRISQADTSRQTSVSSQTRSTAISRDGAQYTASPVRSSQPSRCRTNGDCSGGAQCAQGYCLCPIYQVMKDGRCQAVITEAQTSSPTITTASKSCVASNQCADGAECISGVCRCPQGTVASRFGFCVPLRTGTFLQ
ncbi:Prion-like-(Q/N-rich) domain-bearing protein 25 [Toxocara canis]|uniref:Prion-like-(Q/N-rich) domain-bearing protein 25 n=1 Tax=Toxocara canis TaxID=6265 RepID=A0A0B2UYM6_TOXCA|nr:Prion-like-(Q/N-rich) domain-bearing protein 25 [Toxocara canis]